MNTIELSEENEVLIEKSRNIKLLKNEFSKIIVGQKNLIEKIIIALLSDGHLLIEGVPGLAKTLTVKTLSQLIGINFHRIQFTPDLLPADIIGTMIYNPKESTFEVKKGPIFTNLILADEINRSPAKVQSALLEAMQERQITIGDTTYELNKPFLVMATQNPIEQEGTYPLPEAQVDRFMFKVLVEYPNEQEELEILKKMSIIASNQKIKTCIKNKDILDSKKIINQIYIAENLQKYIVSLILATRNPKKYKINDLDNLISFGASPRASIFLTIASKTKAFLEERSYVTPQDIRDVSLEILRHRIILTYEAEAEELSPDYIINRIFESIPTP